MQRLSLMFLALLIAGCGEDEEPPPDRYVQYRDIGLKKGMVFAQITKQLGEPDRHTTTREGDPQIRHDHVSYGPFNEHDSEGRLIKMFRLRMWFNNGRLVRWTRTTPSGGGP